MKVAAAKAKTAAEAAERQLREQRAANQAALQRQLAERDQRLAEAAEAAAAQRKKSESALKRLKEQMQASGACSCVCGHTWQSRTVPNPPFFFCKP